FAARWQRGRRLEVNVGATGVGEAAAATIEPDVSQCPAFTDDHERAVEGSVAHEPRHLGAASSAAFAGGTSTRQRHPAVEPHARWRMEEYQRRLGELVGLASMLGI